MPAANALQRARTKPFGETFRCPGGALCLDFCNSGQGAHNRSGIEWLADCGDLLVWLEAAGALGAAQAKRFDAAARAAPERAAALLARAIALRETLRQVFEAGIRGEAPPREALARLESEHARGAAFARLAWRHGRGVWELDPSASDLDALLQPVVQSAFELLTSEALARVRRCGNPTCYWLFIDETRNRSRRWCEMASCGNVLKVRRHRARARAAGARGG
jgi:predicted RNA-binding Zn ribbon-like protein